MQQSAKTTAKDQCQVKVTTACGKQCERPVSGDCYYSLGKAV